MSNIIQASIKIKRTTVPGAVGTIPANEDPTSGSWSATDLFDGQWLLNKADSKLFIRSGNTILSIDLNPPAEDPIKFPNDRPYPLTSKFGIYNEGKDIRNLNVVDFIVSALTTSPEPIINSFVIEGDTVLPYGAVFGGNKTITFNVVNPASVQDGVMSLYKLNSGSADELIASGIVISGGEASVSFPSVSYEEILTEQYYLQVDSISGGQVTSNIVEVNWVGGVYVGYMETSTPSQEELLEANYHNLTSQSNILSLLPTPAFSPASIFVAYTGAEVIYATSMLLGGTQVEFSAETTASLQNQYGVPLDLKFSELITDPITTSSSVTLIFQ